MSLLASLRDFFTRYGTDKIYWLAYSGGLDSHVLLTLCHALRDELALSLRVVHVNHGLSANAQQWSQHCRQVCATLSLDYLEKNLQLNFTAGDSLEAVARDQRYAVLAECLQTNDILLTAHQQDDQAETVLLQLMRGAGVQGLAAMPVCKPFALGWHARPLLDFSRAELLAYAQAKQLLWIEDESNLNLDLTRNFLRQSIMPLLRERWPSVQRAIARSGWHCAQAQSILDEIAEVQLAQVAGSQQHTVSVKKLLALDATRQRLLLRAWIQREGHPLPDTKKLTSIMQHVLTAASDRQPNVEWQESIVRRFRDDLFIMPLVPMHQAASSYVWDLRTNIHIPGVGHLSAVNTMGSGLRANLSAVEVRLRTGGEQVYCARRGTRALKQLLQEWEVPPWERDAIPLIYSDDKLIAVVGYFIAEEVLAKENEPGVEIQFKR